MLGGLCALHGNPAPSSSDVPGTQLTWEDCVRLATKLNPDLQASREAVINSDAVRMGAYSALYPQIAISFGDTRSYQGAIFSHLTFIRPRTVNSSRFPN